MTQANLAEALNISNRTISKWKNGDGMPDITILPDLAKALNVSIDELLSGERKEVAELKVTEIENKDTISNWFKIQYIIALFLGVFSACLSFVTLAYNIWAFNILFYNHWEIIFVAVSLFSVIASALFYTIGVTKLSLSYKKDEILKIAGKKGWYLAMILSVLPYMFLLRIIDVSRFGYYTFIFAIIFAIIFGAIFFLVRRKLNEKIN